MVTPDGLAKVLDFGLAKLAGEEDSPHDAFGESDTTVSIHVSERPKTAEGAIIGTVAYMSPEQAQGHRVDARSDIFSFGAVLYEMVTGERAFHGSRDWRDSDQRSCGTTRGVFPPSTSMCPAELQEVVMRCLRKDPDQRFQSMGDVKSAIEQIFYWTLSGIMPLDSGMSGVWKRPALAMIPSIAVLPFLNLSADKENEYFSDGLAEEIINALGKLENLRVTARTSAFVFRGTQQNAPDRQALHVS